ncbi:uncharacterized protein VTP21DRAFT_10312 [Calcarisporiella thermophila]|uniref:uncharacterized protein n=1 Tax=Calcarisporiella thermophila TaxID=911321 RepID=UPI003741EB9C
MSTVEAKTDLVTPNAAYIRAVKDCLSGTAGGLLQVVVGQPFDTVKVRLQTMPRPLPGEVPRYTGMLDCVTKTVKNEGVKGLYKGTTMPLVGIGACVSIQFLTLEHMKREFSKQNEGGPLSLGQLYLAGAIAGTANAFVSGPVEHIRTRLQVQTGGSGGLQYQGPVDCIRKIYSQSGIAGIYRGQTATMVREFHGFGAYFLAYEFLVRQAMDRKKVRRDELPTWQVLMFGASAGVAMWLSVYPVDLVKSKMQTDGILSAERNFKSTLECVKKTWRSEGAGGFFRGFGPCMLRAAPVNAATFLGFELAMRAMN